MKGRSRLLKGSVALALVFSFCSMGTVHAEEPPENGVAKIQEQTYPTIIDAMNAAKDGDTILVDGRVYWGGNDEQQGQENDSKTVTITNGENGSVIVNGANSRGDSTPNVTHLDCGVIFKDITIEESAGVNYFYANGNHLELQNVTFAYKGSQASGELDKGGYWAFIGGSDRESVASTQMIIGKNDADIVTVIGGGVNHDVTGDANTTITSDDSVYNLFGGGAKGNVGGKVTLKANNASNVVAGSFYGNVGSTDLTINGTVSSFTAYAGSQIGHVVGDTHVTLSSSGIIERTGLIGGCSNDTRNPFDGNWRGEFDFGELDATKYETFVGGDTHVTVNGIAKEAVYGGGKGPVKGDTYVTINGTVYGSFLAEGVFGGGYGSDVNGDTHVIISENANIPTVVAIDKYNTKEECLLGGTVFGGGRASKVHGDTYVTVNGRVGSEGYGGLVFGGGCRGSNDVGGTSHVEINVAPYAYTHEEKLGWYEFGKYDFLCGLSGVYGGGFNNPGTHDTVININTDMGDTVVYGDGLCGYVDNATIYMNQDAIAKTIYGFYNEEGNERPISGEARVIYRDGNHSTTRQIINADLVEVRDNARVIIDNEMKDNEQLIQVADLRIHENAQLTLGASAHILGNYAGDEGGTGTFIIPAGKNLTVDGTVTNLTNISIIDAVDGTIPEKAQVYVISKAGSTVEDGDFIWIDQRNSVTMDWRQATDGMSQWWLVGYYSVTVNYLDAETEEVIHPQEMIELKEGLEYDMSEFDAVAIEGYTYQETIGETSGILDGHKVINVYYAEDEEPVPPVVEPVPPVVEPVPPIVDPDLPPVEDDVLGDKEKPEVPVVEVPEEPQVPVVEDEVLGDTKKPDTSDINAMNIFVMTMVIGAMGVVILKKREE